MVAVSVDPPETNRAFVEKAKLPFAVLSDPDRALIGRLGILHERAGPRGSNISTPATYVIDRDGKVVWMRVAPDVRTRPDPADVLAAIKK